MERETKMERMIDIGSGIMLPVDFGKLAIHQNVIEHVQDIGARNILMDSHASVVRKDFESDADYRAAKLAVAQKKLETMYSGTARARIAGATRVPTDPIGAEAMRMARVYVGTATRGWEKGADAAIEWLVKAADLMKIELPEQPTADDWKDIIGAAIERRSQRDDVRAAAKEIVDAKAKVATVEIEL
jgi:hypothetical protein